jgi:hypothetical protein
MSFLLFDELVPGSIRSHIGQKFKRKVEGFQISNEKTEIS